MGQLLARESAQTYGSADPGSDSGVNFSWSSHPSVGTASSAQADTSSAVISELQSSVQFVMARIESLDHRPLYWNAQTSELRLASVQLDACQQGTVSNPTQVIQQVQQYTDTVNAQLDEYITQTEARQQQQRQRHSAHQSGASQPSAPPFASSPPASSTTTTGGNAPTSASSNGGRGSWKWGWGPAPADASSSASADEAQQANAIGTGTAAAAAAALASVGSAAASAYRRLAGSGTTSQAQQQPFADPSTSAQGQHSRSGAAFVGASTASSSAAAPSSTAAAGMPVQGVYDAVRNIFDRHVTPDSSLGRWGEVAHHLNDLHGQMNAEDSQRQDAGRLLASAVNAYSAYRRASASSANS